MTKKTKSTLPVTADELAKYLKREGREKFLRCLERANLASMIRTQGLYSRKVGKEFKLDCEWLAVEIGTRYHAVARDGRPPKPLGAFDRDEIVRILATDTTLVYDMYSYDPKSCAIQPRRGFVRAKESWDRKMLIEVLMKYFEAEMIYAFDHGFECLKKIYGKLSNFLYRHLEEAGPKPIPFESAQSILDQEKEATEQLLARIRKLRREKSLKARAKGQKAKEKGAAARKKSRKRATK